MDPHKVIILKDWEEICMKVKASLKKLGHDITIIPEYSYPGRKDKA